MTETSTRTFNPPTTPQPHLDEGWNPKRLSLRLSKKHPKLAQRLIALERRRAEKTTGPGDLSDLLAPGQERAADFPAYYVANPVHGMPGMHGMDPSMGQRQEQMEEDFPMASRAQIQWWVQTWVKDQGIEPRRILDVGSGTGAGALVFADLFPEAEIIGVDISPAMLRWAKKRAARQGVENVAFYHMDAGRLDYFEDNSFDLVLEAHILHEMPTYQNERVVSEMVRLCKPGGMLGFWDWAIPENEKDWKHREVMVRVNAEPFMLQFAKYNFPERLREWGCTDVQRTDRHSQSARWLAFKGENTNELIAPDLARIRATY